ncbi:hypothetical protein A2U01_0082239, partial [Trifolium medium]|nr:hypothetical protein [Trifolium medium]
MMDVGTTRTSRDGVDENGGGECAGEDDGALCPPRESRFVPVGLTED